MSDEFREIKAPMAMFTDPQLVALHKSAEEYLEKGLDGLGYLVGGMAESEVRRRVFNRANPGSPIPSEFGRVRITDWSDMDVGRMVLACWGLSEHTREAGFGELIDAIGETFVQVAFDRLASTGDPRNAIPLKARINANPETN